MRVVVIGAGVVGLACALELRRRGAEVTVLERHVPGAGASSGNAGWITPVFATPLPAPGVVTTSLRWMLQPDSPLFIKPRADPSLIGWLWSFWRHSNARDFERGVRAYAALASHALADFDALTRDGVAVDIESRGVLFLFTTTAGAEHMSHEVDLMAPFGYAPPELLSADQVKELEPAVSGQIIGGIVVPGERYVRPESLVAALAAAAMSAGVEVVAGLGADRLVKDGDRVRAATSRRDEIDGDEFVVCAGAWSRPLLRTLGIDIPIEAGRGYGVTVDAPGISLRRPTYLVERRIACTPFAGSLRLAGTMEFAGLDARPEPARFAAIRRGADGYLSGWRGGLEHEWVGPRPVTPDGLPVIGRLSAFRNLSIASGHAMLGLTLAPTTAIAIADLVCDAQSRYDLGAFSPERFR